MFHVQPGDPDRQLVGDDHRLVAAGCVPRVLDRGHHPGDQLLVGLAPRGPKGVPEVPPRGGPAQRPDGLAEPLAHEDVGGLDHPVVGDDLQAARIGQGSSGLLRPLQRGGDQMGDVAVLDRAGDLLGHLPPQVGEVVALAPAVEDAARVVDLPVAQQVDDRVSSASRHRAVLVLLLSPRPARPLAGRRARPAPRGRRGRRRGTTLRTPTAAGGLPRRAWRGRRPRTPRRPGADASSKSRTGSPVKNTENMVPFDWTTCGTPAAVSASATPALTVSPVAVRWA